jgi:iron-sulfur cluster repair protein YtfE (RIC family)
MVHLGKPGSAATGGDVVDALLDCHARIRSFTALAERLASATGSSLAEVRDAAEGVHRYFELALPLHAEDEERSILPRLAGRDAAVDRELAAMRREHGEHGDAVARVLTACAVLRRDPAALPRVGASLAEAARGLAAHFEEHLAREERVIFPALRSYLAPAEQDAIRAEMKARRGV